jgi:hypothetical protein
MQGGRGRERERKEGVKGGAEEMGGFGGEREGGREREEKGIGMRGGICVCVCVCNIYVSLL